nr:hypothetical protein [Candidatus Sigynarchaeum springense]
MMAKELKIRPMRLLAIVIFSVTLLTLVSSSITRTIFVTGGTRYHESEEIFNTVGQARKSTSPLSGITVAVLNEAVSPPYFSGSLRNDYSSVITALTTEGASVTAMTSSQIASGSLAGYDVFIMIDNAPSTACQTNIRAAWMAGTAIMAFDSSICALCYFGILPASSSGSNGQSTYWTYGDTATSRVAIAHPITANYTVNSLVSGTSGDAYWLSSTMNGVGEYSKITVLTSLNGDQSKWTTILYEPASFGAVFFCWDQAHVTNTALKPMIIQAVKYLAFSTNQAPTLLSGQVSPMAGTSSTAFTFTVTYADPENVQPTYIRARVGEYTLNMAKISPSDVNYRDGCMYSASMTLPTGSYTYYFEAGDGARDVSTPSENGPYVGTPPPTLYLSQSHVSKTSGFPFDAITFQVTYTHASNIVPSYIYVRIDSTSYPMSKLYPYDNTYTDGCTFYYSMTLGLGSHTFSFWASDGSTTVYSPTYSGLTVRSFGSTVNLTQATCSPASGDTNTDFQFRVRYTQSYNMAPDFVSVYIDNTFHEMSKESPADTTYDDGCFYIYSTRLSAANHSYYFEASRSGDGIITNSSTVEVRTASIIDDPPSLFTLVFIVLGSVATISTVSIAYKIKVKKALTAPLPMNVASTTRHSPGPVITPEGSSRTLPAQGGLGGISGNAGPLTHGFLPPSAFMMQPFPAPRGGVPSVASVPSTPILDSTPTAGILDSMHPATPEPILPGSPKWMRLARFDISMYMAPPEDSVVNEAIVENDGFGLAGGAEHPDYPTEDPGLEGEARLGEDDFEDSMLGDNVDEKALLAPGTGDDKSPPIAKPETLVVRRSSAEGSPSLSPQAGKSYLVICPACRREIIIDGNEGGIVYDCKRCRCHVLYVAKCIACQSRAEIQQDELQNAQGGGIRCPVCWEKMNV